MAPVASLLLRQKIGLLFLAAAVLVGVWLVSSFSIEMMGVGLGFFLVGALLLLQSKNSLASLLEEKRKILQELSGAEQKFLAREMTEQAFGEFSAQKRARLVELESRIERMKTQSVASAQELEKIAAGKKHILREFLKEKDFLLSQQKIGEQKYLNRELAEKEFFELQQKTQGRLLEIEAEIKNLVEGQNMQAVLAELQQKLRQTEPSRRMRRKQRRGTVSETDQMAQDLLEQTPAEK